MTDLTYWDCYILVLEVSETTMIKLRKQYLYVEPDIYIYIGSSRKPGLALSRLARHLVREKKRHWHIDHLTTSPNTTIRGVFLLKTKYKDCEYELTKLFVNKNLEYVKRFGASDKAQEPSHLFKCDNNLSTCLSQISSCLESNDSIKELVYAI
ncbi:MAG: GIY-YIG nuclease family protein [Desulfurococcaceae archaeon]